MLTVRVMLCNNRMGISRTGIMWRNTFMDTFTIRRANLRHLIDTKFGRNQAAFAEAVGCKPPQVNRWLSTTATDPRNITETSARSIERKLGLISGWLDQEHHGDTDLPAADAEFLDALQENIQTHDVPDHVKQAILTLISSSPKKS